MSDENTGKMSADEADERVSKRVLQARSRQQQQDEFEAETKTPQTVNGNQRDTITDKHSHEAEQEQEPIDQATNSGENSEYHDDKVAQWELTWESIQPHTVQKYLQSYQTHVHHMYPLITKAKLDASVDQVLKEAGIMDSDGRPTGLGQWEGSKPLAGAKFRPSLETALAFLVLAFGKLCECRIPELQYANQSLALGWHEPAPSTAQQKRYLPGAEYYTEASRMLSSFIESSEMGLVHAHIIASLYCEQLGHVTASVHHIRFAASALIVGTNSELRMRNHGRVGAIQLDSKKDAERITTYWICHQIESHHLIQTNFWWSGLAESEDKFPCPDVGEAMHQLGVTPEAACSLTANTHLSRWLHRNLTIHSRTEMESSIEKQISVIKSFEDNVAQKRGLWLGPLNFEDHWPWSSDIVTARTHAAFWEARIEVYRPFIKTYQQLMKDLTSSRGQHGSPYLNPESRRMFQTGVDTLLNSMTVFCGVQKMCLISMSMASLARTQSRNLLTLSALCRDPRMGSSVNIDATVEQTIRFIHECLHKSTTFHRDKDIIASQAAAVDALFLYHVRGILSGRSPEISEQDLLDALDV